MIKTGRQVCLLAWFFLCVAALKAFWLINQYKQEYSYYFPDNSASDMCEQQAESSTESSLDLKDLLLVEEGDSAGDDFFPINRTLDDVRNAAVDFARAYKLEAPVLELYTVDPLSELEQKNRRQKKYKVPQKKTARKNNNQQFDAKRWSKHSLDPRFNLPIEKGKFWLSSPFGPRKNPNGTSAFHYGIDMAAWRGTPIKAAAGGVIVKAGYQKGYGNVVVIQHDKKFKTRYAHFSKIRSEIVEGKKVKDGQVLGYVGSTGNARASGKMRDGSHLHFEVEVFGKRMNPFYFFKK